MAEHKQTKQQTEGQAQAQARHITYNEPMEPKLAGVPDVVTPEVYAHAKATTPADMWPMYSEHFDARLKEHEGRTKAAKAAQAVEAGSAATDPAPAPADAAPADAETASKKK